MKQIRNAKRWMNFLKFMILFNIGLMILYGFQNQYFDTSKSIYWSLFALMCLVFSFIFAYRAYYKLIGFRIKLNVSTIGLSKLDREHFEFHITPVVTYSYIAHPSHLGYVKTLAIEWGHWALCLHIGYFSINQDA